MIPYFLRFADLLTDNDIVDLYVPFKAERKIIEPAGFSSSFLISDEAMGERVAKIIPTRTVVYAHHGSDIIGCYLIWSKKLSRSGSGVTCELQGATLESYFYRRILEEDLVYTGTDQISIALQLFGEATTGPSSYPDSAELGLDYDYSFSGVLRDREYLASDSSSFGELIENIANCDAGFEYTIDAHIEGTTRYRTVRFGYPKLSTLSTPIMVEEPGSILGWSLTVDGSQGATRFRTRGATPSEDSMEETEPLVSSWHEADAFLAAGWPLLDYSYDYQTVSDVATLNTYADWWCSNRSGPFELISLTLNPAAMFAHGFSPFSLGADITAALSNPAFPPSSGSPGKIVSTRLIGFSLSVSQTGAENIEVLVESDFDVTGG